MKLSIKNCSPDFSAKVLSALFKVTDSPADHEYNKSLCGAKIKDIVTYDLQVDMANILFGEIAPSVISDDDDRLSLVDQVGEYEITGDGICPDCGSDELAEWGSKSYREYKEKEPGNFTCQCGNNFVIDYNLKIN